MKFSHPIIAGLKGYLGESGFNRAKFIQTAHKQITLLQREKNRIFRRNLHMQSLLYETNIEKITKASSLFIGEIFTIAGAVGINIVSIHSEIIMIMAAAASLHPIFLGFNIQSFQKAIQKNKKKLLDSKLSPLQMSKHLMQEWLAELPEEARTNIITTLQEQEEKEKIQREGDTVYRSLKIHLYIFTGSKNQAFISQLAKTNPTDPRLTEYIHKIIIETKALELAQKILYPDGKMKIALSRPFYNHIISLFANDKYQEKKEMVQY